MLPRNDASVDVHRRSCTYIRYNHIEHVYVTFVRFRIDNEFRFRLCLPKAAILLENLPSDVNKYQVACDKTERKEHRKSAGVLIEV